MSRQDESPVFALEATDDSRVADPYSAQRVLKLTTTYEGSVAPILGTGLGHRRVVLSMQRKLLGEIKLLLAYPRC